jgi:4'-phosphopantetheinyl transferase
MTGHEPHLEWAAAPEQPALEGSALHLWLIRLDRSGDEIDRSARILSPAEQDRAQRFHFERDARRYTVAHAALRVILSQYAGMRPADLCFETNHYGKPFLVLADTPANPHLSFNLSHSGELALVGITSGRKIGVDIEQIRPELAGGEIAEKFFSPNEVLDLRSLPQHEQALAFFRCWTRKEAFVKARGEGLSFPLASFDVTLRPDDPPRLVRVAGDPEQPSRWSVISLAPGGSTGYAAAAAVEGMPSQVCAWHFANVF